MASYFIVGPPGVGKTTVLEYLQDSGYAILDADMDPALCGWVDKASGQKVADWSAEQSTPPPNCTWGWDTDRMYEITSKPSGDPFFFAGNTAGAVRFYPLFNKVFALFADDNILIQRLTSPRNNPNNYGQKPEHIEQTIAINKNFTERERLRGAVLIDAMRPIEMIVNDLLKSID